MLKYIVITMIATLTFSSDSWAQSSRRVKPQLPPSKPAIPGEQTSDTKNDYPRVDDNSLVDAVHTNGGYIEQALLSSQKQHVLNFIIPPGRIHAGETLLNAALLQMHTAPAEALIRAGANIEHKSSMGGTALHLAAGYFYYNQFRSFTEEEKKLKNAEADEMVRALIKAGANIEAKNDYGFTPLHLAATMGRHDAVVELLKAGANPNAVEVGRMSILASAAIGSDLKTVQALVEAGAKVTLDDVRAAVQAANFYTAKYLIEQGSFKPEELKGLIGVPFIWNNYGDWKHNAFRLNMLLLRKGVSPCVFSGFEGFNAVSESYFHMRARREFGTATDEELKTLGQLQPYIRESDFQQKCAVENERARGNSPSRKIH